MSRRSGWVVAAIALLCVLTGCSTNSELARIRAELVALGFDDAGVHVRHTAGTKMSEDRAEVVLIGGRMDDGAARAAAAELIWDELPMRFDTLLIEHEGDVTIASYAELEADLGPRPEGTDGSIPGYLAGVLGAVLAVLGAFLAIVLVPVVVLVKRNRRRTRRTSETPNVDV